MSAFDRLKEIMDLHTGNSGIWVVRNGDYGVCLKTPRGEMEGHVVAEILSLIPELVDEYDEALENEEALDKAFWEGREEAEQESREEIEDLKEQIENLEQQLREADEEVRRLEAEMENL